MFEPLGTQLINDELNCVIKSLLTAPLGTDLKALRKYLPYAHWKLLAILQSECLKDVSKRKYSTWRLFNTTFDVNEIRIVSKIGTHEVRLDANLTGYQQGIWDQITTNLERDGISPNNVLPEVRFKLIMFYGLVDATILSFSGILAPGSKLNILGYSKTELGTTMHFNYWFSRYWAQQSNFGNLVEDMKIVSTANQERKTVTKYLSENPDKLNASANLYIDKVLSINTRFISYIPDEAKPLLEELRSRLRILVYCHLRTIEDICLTGEPINNLLFASRLPCNITASDFHEVGIPIKNVQKLLNWSNDQPETERIIFFNSTDYQLGNISITHGILRFGADILRELGSILGDWFERDYILRYIKSEVNPHRYRVHSGFKAGNKETSKYDIDFVIEDLIGKRVFFCQAKYRIKTTFPTLKSSLLEFFYGDQINKGLGQLKALENVLSDERVRQKLNAIPPLQGKTDDWIKNNTSFILIHNVENFDFLKYDGVALYEWNSIRNLMHDSIGMKNSKGEIIGSFCTKSLCLSDVKENMVAITNWLEKNAQFEHKPYLHWKMIQGAKVYFTARRNWGLVKRAVFSKQILTSVPLI